MKKEYTPDVITHLNENEIFVFGANERYFHGAGAAAFAVKKFGAKMGEAGLVGQSYGIPTKDSNIRTLPLFRIKIHVDSFIEFAENHPHPKFYVTPIGTGLAGLRIEDIAPLFAAAIDIPNIILPELFVRHINESKT